MRKVAYLISTLFLLSACDADRVFEENVSIENNQWKHTDKVQLLVEVTDTVNPMNVYVNIRHTAHYPFSNLWLFIHQTGPDNQRQTDTLECVLAEKDGRWTGQGLGDIWDTQTVLKRLTFPAQGSYQFEIEQAMRYGDQEKMDLLPEVMDVGLRIEYAAVDE